MKFSFENSQSAEKPTTKTESYTLESGLTVEVQYLELESVEGEPNEAVIFLAGLQMNPGDKVLESISQSYLESTERNTYVVQTKLRAGSEYEATEDADLFYDEARGLAEFIKEKQLDKVLIVGYSIGGVRGIDLAHVLQSTPEINVDGLVLLSSPGLYEQEPGDLKSNLIKDSLLTPQQVLQKRTDYPDAFRRGLHGAQNLLRVIMKGSAVKREFSEMEQYNQHVEALNIPVVVVQGAEDQVVEAEKIVPAIVDPSDREEYLKEHIFKNSPYVKMVVADKLGKHGLPIFRAESVANASVGLLDRYYRSLE